MSIIFDTPKDTQLRIAKKFKNLRLLRDLRRSSLAELSGVPAASIKRFEVCGEISLKSLLRLAYILGGLEQFSNLFDPPPALSLTEIEERAMIGMATRKRGHK